MVTPLDHAGRPTVVVTGMGVVTANGAGKADNWRKLVAGQSGIKAITRFCTDGLRTRVAGTVDFLAATPLCAPELSERLAELAVEEALDDAQMARGSFPGPLFLAVGPVELEWPQRRELAQASGANGAVTYHDLLRAAETGGFRHFHR